MEQKSTLRSPAYLVKVDEAQGIVTAIVNVYGIVDDGDDMTVMGCCSKTLQENRGRIKVLNSHQSWDVLAALGTMISAREVGRDELPAEVLAKWPEATGALETTTQYLMSTPEGKGAFERIRTGAISEFSIGYRPIKAEYAEVDWRGEKRRVRLLKEIKLYEYSPVVWGMNPATAVTGMKADDAKEMTGDGPKARLGDFLAGAMRQTVDYSNNGMLMRGRLSPEEHQQITAALDAGIAAFNAALPESLRLSPVSVYGMYYDSATAPDAQKDATTPETLEDKIGRTLSEANATRIRATLDLLKSATTNLETVLVNAGVIDDEQDDEADTADDTSSDDGKSQTPLAGPDAGATPDAPPTDEERSRLLKLIEIELDMMEMTA